MGKISFDVNNGGKLNICQAKHDGSVSVSTGESKGYNISAGDFVMLLNFYKYRTYRLHGILRVSALCVA